MKLDRAIVGVQEAELDLADELRAVVERHAVEHDLYHLGHALVRRCAEQIELLAPAARRYGVSEVRQGGESAGLLELVRRKSAELAGRSEVAGMLLLRDLRNLYLTAQEAEIAWMILGQAARAARDAELLDAVAVGHEHAEIRGRWLRARIKETAPQVLATG